MAELVEHVEHPILASIVGAVLDEVIGPDMIALLRPQPNARSVGQPEPAALGLLMGNLQPLTLPDTLDPLATRDLALRRAMLPRAPHRRDARTHAAALAPARYRQWSAREIELQALATLATPAQISTPSAAHLLSSHQILVQNFVADRDRQKGRRSRRFQQRSWQTAHLEANT
jgi:hypothetical protein